MLTALAGGVGAARFLAGLTKVTSPEDICIIGNTADDAEIHGLQISPDLDTVMYTLAGLADPVQGWGVAGDTYRGLDALQRLGAETWFRLGDQDLATHIVRTESLRRGIRLSRVTAQMASALGVRSTILPMSDDPVRTVVRTRDGLLPFQAYFVRRRAQDKVLGIRFDGADKSRPAPGVLRNIRSAQGIVFCPSNPIISIGPILAVPGIRAAIEKRKCRSVAVSPIVGGKALKGPAAAMMRSLGLEPSSVGVARAYRGLVNTLVIDHADAELVPAIRALDVEAVVTNTVMTTLPVKKALAKTVLDALRKN